MKVVTKLTLTGIFAATCALYATPLPLSNTGTIGTACQGTVTLSGGCTLMTNGQVGDPHYTLNTGQTVAATSAGGSPIVSGPWLGDNTTSTWIRPYPLPNAAGNYVYTQTFNAGVAGPGSIISGRWATDNKGKMYLNGVLVAETPNGSTSFTTWHSFTITSGFVVGLNTLEFRVNNAAAPSSGLRVEFSKATLPEPAEVATTFGLLAGAFWMARRRRNVAVAA